VPAFRYEAVDPVGATRKGVVNADSARAARTDLRAQGLVPLVVDAITTQIDDAGQTRRRGFGDRLSTNELALFTRQLASLLEASLPLEQAFAALLEQAERPYLRDLVASIRSEVMGGSSLSDALGRHPRDFAEIYRALVSSGEQIGQLSRVLSRLADYIERRNALVQKVKLAFTYPAIVTVVAFAIVIFLLTYVVPQIVSVFANTKQKLPFLTVMMLAISDFTRNYGWMVALVLVTAWFVWRNALKNPEIKMRWHTWLLTAPCTASSSAASTPRALPVRWPSRPDPGCQSCGRFRPAAIPCPTSPCASRSRMPLAACARALAWRGRCRRTSIFRQC
jgi:general secretion pathway protein F